MMTRRAGYELSIKTPRQKRLLGGADFKATFPPFLTRAAIIDHAGGHVRRGSVYPNQFR
jgi:hypothetical protein